MGRALHVIAAVVVRCLPVHDFDDHRLAGVVAGVVAGTFGAVAIIEVAVHTAYFPAAPAE
jgi:hypothetical protein